MVTLKSVQAKCLALVLATAVATTVVAVTLGARSAQSLAMELFAKSAVNITENIGKSGAGALRFGKPDKMIEAQESARMSSDGQLLASVVFLPDRTEFAADGEGYNGSSQNAADLADEAFNSEMPVVAENGLVYAVPARAKPGGPVIGVVVTSWSTEHIESVHGASSRNVILCSGGLLALMCLAAWWLLNTQIVRPMRQIENSISDVEAKRFDVEVPCKDRSDEIGRIAIKIESLRGSLKTADAQERKLQTSQSNQKRVVRQLSEGLTAFSAGDLNFQLNEPFAAEYEELRVNFNRAVGNLRDAVRDVLTTTDRIRGNSQTLSQSSEDLSQRTVNQAATLEETVAALTDLTHGVRVSAENAQDVDAIVTKANKDAEANGAVVTSAVNAMNEIKESSSQIEQIISVIDDIAFQTNLLALNAGVEAARAGEAGKGFAVVASEVRALAKRSSDAAKEIKGLISGSAEQVERGSDLVNDAGTALKTIVDQIAHIAELVSAIAEGSQEQSGNLSEISNGLAELDQVTQQNAGMVEDTTQIGQSIQSDADGLTDVLARFQLGQGAFDQRFAAE